MPLKFPPLFEHLPYQPDSCHYFELVRHLPWAVFLDSTTKTSQDNRYDIIAADPFLTLGTKGEKTVIEQRSGHKKISELDPFHLLQRQLKSFPIQRTTSLPFCGGAIGHFGYDLGRRIEKLPNIAIDNEETADMLVGIYDWAIITDHQKKQSYIASYGLHSQTQPQWSSLLGLLNRQEKKDNAILSVSGPIRSELSLKQYQTAFNKIKRYIREGDCYQVNLAKRFEG